MDRMDNAIIVVVVVFPFCLLCRHVVDRQMVLCASENGVLLDCPRIPFVLSVTPPYSQTTEAKRKTRMTIATTQMTMAKDELLSPTMTTISNPNPFCIHCLHNPLPLSQLIPKQSAQRIESKTRINNAPTRPSSEQPNSASRRVLIVLD